MHTIYGLVDPRDSAIFYVGMTINLERRVLAHMRLMSGNVQQTDRIRELHVCGLTFDVEIFEEVEGQMLAREREKHWILFCLREDEPLTNILMNASQTAKVAQSKLVNFSRRDNKTRTTRQARKVLSAIGEYGIDNILLDLPDYAELLSLDERTLKTWVGRFLADAV